MSSNIFKVKINSFDIKHINVEQLLDYCFETPRLDFNFKKYVDLLSIELDSDESPRFISYSRFRELLKINHDKLGDAFFTPLINEHGKEFQNLQESYSTNRITSVLHPGVLIWNNILAQLKVGDFRPLPVLELSIELAQDHDGIVAFPNHKGLGIKSIIYREFIIRILTDLQRENPFSGIIDDWFESGNGNLYPDYPNRISYGGEDLDLDFDFDVEEGIVWGIEERHEIVIELDDTTFQDKYRGAWWVERIKSVIEYNKKYSPGWAEANKEYPFQVKTFSIIMHPAWFGSVSEVDLDQIYDSTAYGY